MFWCFVIAYILSRGHVSFFPRWDSVVIPVLGEDDGERWEQLQHIIPG